MIGQYLGRGMRPIIWAYDVVPFKLNRPAGSDAAEDFSWMDAELNSCWRLTRGLVIYWAWKNVSVLQRA